MNKNKHPFGEFLLWAGTVLLFSVYALLVQLLISFLFLYKRYNWTFSDMMKVTLGVALVVAIFQPMFRRWKLKNTVDEEKDWGDWHKQN